MAPLRPSYIWVLFNYVFFQFEDARKSTEANARARARNYSHKPSIVITKATNFANDAD